MDKIVRKIEFPYKKCGRKVLTVPCDTKVSGLSGRIHYKSHEKIKDQLKQNGGKQNEERKERITEKIQGSY